MVAEKAETQEEFEWVMGAGYDYFQGYCFARPETVCGTHTGVETDLSAPEFGSPLRGMLQDQSRRLHYPR